MSILQILREKAGVLVAGVIGLSLLLFVVSDFFGGGRGQRRQARRYYEIGKIAGEDISYQDYEQRIQNLTEIYKLSGNTNIDENTIQTIREQVWQQMVREKILDRQYKDLGIGVSNEEVDELVLGNNPHQIVTQLFTDRQTGVFNKSFLINFLKSIEVDANAKKYWLFFEDEIVSDRMNMKYNTLVAKGLYVTSKQTEFESTLNRNTVDFSYIMKNYSTVPDSAVKVTHDEIVNYYESHKENYKRGALRNIEYVAFDVVPSEDDIRQAEIWINKTKEEFVSAPNPVEFINLTADTRHIGYYYPINEIPDNLKDFVRKEDKTSVFGPYLENGSYKIARLLSSANRPDSVHARHILLSPNQTRTMEQAKVQADSLIKLLKSGTPFETLVLLNSDDQGSAQIGGDLGWFPEGRMILPFNNACFTAKKGELLNVQTNFGIHIIEILDISKPGKKYEIGIVDRKILPSSATNQNIYGEASQFAGTNDTYEKFTKAIAEKGLTKRSASDVTPQQKTLPELENPRLLVMALFQAEEGRIILDNNQQAVFELDEKYVVAYCTRVQEEGTAPLGEVENEIRFALLKDKKADYIAGDLKKMIEPGKTLEDISKELGLTVGEASKINFSSYSVSGSTSDPALIAAASVAKQGTVAGPVKGNDGVYLLTVNSFTVSGADDMKMLKERLSTTFNMRGNYEAYEALRKEADITDKRYKFY